MPVRATTSPIRKHSKQGRLRQIAVYGGVTPRQPSQSPCGDGVSLLTPLSTKGEPYCNDRLSIEIKYVEEVTINEASHSVGSGHCAMRKSARPQGATERAF